MPDVAETSVNNSKTPLRKQDVFQLELWFNTELYIAVWGKISVRNEKKKQQHEK